METGIYAVYDKKLGEFVSRSLGLAKGDEVLLRELRQAWRVPGHEESFLEKAPGDYDMMYLGTFDVETGRIDPVEPAVILNFSKLDKEVAENAARGKEG